MSFVSTRIMETGSGSVDIKLCHHYKSELSLWHGCTRVTFVCKMYCDSLSVVSSKSLGTKVIR
jgi:hypothetical protein